MRQAALTGQHFHGREEWIARKDGTLIPVEMRWLMILYVIWDLHPVLLALAGDRVFSGIAHSAHLGGLAFGFLYGWYQWRLEPLIDWLPWPGAKGKPRSRLRLAPATLPEPPPDADMRRVDDILKKISESGQDSLTDEERDTLRKVSDRIRRGLGRGG